MSGAQALVRSLARHGVEVVFGLPGVQIMDVFDALYDEPGIRMVLTRHEQATTYMADGYARTTGKPGVALVVPGPGALNATAGLGTAYATSSPVLLVSGQIESYNLGQNRGALHEIGEQLDVFKHLTKWCGRSDKVNEIPGMVRNAFQEMSSGRPRPVEIEIPWDVLSMTDETELPEPEGPVKQQPEPALIREAAQLLAGASRPLIWAGGGTRDAAVSSELMDLAEALNSPVITTPEGKGAIPENSPLSLGSFYYAHGPGHIALPQADVILAVGSRMMFTPNVPWGIQPHQRVVQIDADPEELGRNIPATVGIAADARLGWTETEITAIRQQADLEIREMAPLQVEIIETIRHELDDDAIMVAGTTDIGYWSHLAYPVLAPRSYLTSSYFATLGKGINVVTLVFNNEMLGASHHDQQQRFGGRVIGTRLHNPDFAQLAEAYGAVGVRLDSHEGWGTLSVTP
ncbi:Probable acetolactate synthase large subunit [Geodia barretti]|uniref:Probable acetolactate synthase large subunit n=1 Tax=Geodia barretti TaxID=519541 RepID=A0AA35TNN9_GEOBA|nr:Probable acetolactate synthase large subunit [Geodia barretti]